MNLATSQGFATASVPDTLRARQCRSAFRILASATALLVSGAVALEAYPITQIGNAKFGSDDLGFEATLSRPFTFARSLARDGALLVSQGDDVFRGGEPLVILPLAEQLPGTETFSRPQFRRVFQKPMAPGTRVTRVRAADACVEAFVLSSEGATWGVAGWGEGRGVVFRGDTEGFVNASIGAMLASIEVDEGACAWRASE